MTAVAGAHNIKINESSQQYLFLYSYTKHPQYNPNNMINDIAIIQFTSPVTFNSYVSALPLPKPQVGEWLRYIETFFTYE